MLIKDPRSSMVGMSVRHLEAKKKLWKILISPEERIRISQE
jgi:hypothetical protein